MPSPRRRKPKKVNKVNGRRFNPVDYSPLAVQIGQAMKAIREGLGYSPTAVATELGCRLDIYKKIEEGRFPPTRELRRRFVRYCFANESWRSHPTLPATVRKRQEGISYNIRFYDTDLVDQWKTKAHAIGASMSAFAEEAIRRLIADEPTIVSIKQAIQSAERMRAKQILDANPDILEILEGDPLQARLVHMTTEVRPAPLPRLDEKQLTEFDPKTMNGPAMRAKVGVWTKGRTKP